MADPIRNNESHEYGATGSPLGTDPQESEPLPGDPREAQEPQEPRTSHTGPGGDAEAAPHRAGASDRTDTDRTDTGAEPGSERSTVDQLRKAWDRVRGKE